jgi:hypothetical protein
MFLAHFYSRDARIKLGSGKKPQPYRVLYIVSNKRLNNYYAPRVVGSDTARHINPSVFNLPPMQPL